MDRQGQRDEIVFELPAPYYIDVDGIGGTRKGGFAPLELNCIARTWNPVSVPADISRNWHHILGFDGLSLVTLSAGNKLRRLAWGEATSAAPTQ